LIGASLQRSHGYVEGVNGVRLHYRTWEVARPRAALVVVHGLAEHAGDVYEAAREALEARPLLRQFDSLQAAIDVAAPGEVEELLRRKEAMRSDLQRRFPNEWRRRPLRRAGRR
jgi:hypothetical protein